MPQSNATPRRHYSAEQKAQLLRRHFLDRVPVSTLCDENRLQPSQFYRWQQRLFVCAHLALQEPAGADNLRRHLEQQLLKAREELAAKDALIAKLAQHYFLSCSARGSKDELPP